MLTDTHTPGFYFGVLLRGERCEGLEGLDGVDFAVNLQSLCALTAASLIICGGPPITVENQAWEGQKIYHSFPSPPFLPQTPSVPLFTALSHCEGGAFYCLLFKVVVITHISLSLSNIPIIQLHIWRPLFLRALLKGTTAAQAFLGWQTRAGLLAVTVISSVISQPPTGF